MPYTLIDHTADIGIRVCAHTVRSLFEEAAYALVDVMGARTPEGTDHVSIETRGIDRVDLLVRWLQEVLYLVEVKDFRIKDVLVQTLSETQIRAFLKGAYTGEPLETEIKAVTYHNLNIQEIDNACVATIILDT
jgi:protein archease